MENIKASIIIPVYNQEDLVGKTIKSALSQDFNCNYEVIVIDDESYDSTFDIVSIISKTDSRIKVFRKKHGGVSSARNFGISKCSGEYICFLDSDDLIFFNYLSSQVNILESNSNFDIAICPFMSYISHKKTFQPGFFYKNFYSLHIFANIIGFLDCCLFKRCVIDKLIYFDTSLDANEDYDFLFRAVMNNFYFVPNFNTISIYRYHNNNSSNKLDWDNACYKIAKKFDYIIEKNIKNFSLINIYGCSIVYIIFSASILGYAVKSINKSQQNVEFFLNMAIRYLSKALSCNDINMEYFCLINLYMCLIRNLSNNFLYCRHLHNILNKFRYILPMSFNYNASSEELKKLASQNYVQSNTIISIFNSGIKSVLSFL